MQRFLDTPLGCWRAHDRNVRHRDSLHARGSCHRDFRVLGTTAPETTCLSVRVTTIGCALENWCHGVPVGNRHHARIRRLDRELFITHVHDGPLFSADPVAVLNSYFFGLKNRAVTTNQNREENVLGDRYTPAFFQVFSEMRRARSLLLSDDLSGDLGAG